MDTTATVQLSSTEIDPHRPIGEITGEFFVPAYQRGYRWTPEDVTRLLNDIEQSLDQHKDKPYTLQPIVVRQRVTARPEGSPALDQWELIDGQQRLTTLYLIFLVMRDRGWKKNAARYSLVYETRPRWTNFQLEVIPHAESNIDFYHLSQAYGTIVHWFAHRSRQQLDDYQQEERANDLFGYLNRYVRVIWYEPHDTPGSDAIASEQAAITLFTRLNVGRIALNDAELVKAQLLATVRATDKTRAEETAAQWDGIERDLQRAEVWSFISSAGPAETSLFYPTRISHLLEAIADGNQPPPAKRPRYSTFETLRERIQRDPNALWQEVTKLHSQILGWMEDVRWHNKIGFLVTTHHMRFAEILRASLGRKKSDFDSWLTDAIRESVDLSPAELLELSYENANDKDRLLKILLLFNVETLTRSGQFFPFAKHTNEAWSLEHIHAQHSRGMNKEDQWRTWLKVQHRALSALAMDVTEADQKARADHVLRSIGDALRGGTVSGETFEALYTATIPFFGAGETDHSIRNLALLSCRDNSALNNAVFEAKRLIILEQDRQGHYIPICTRHVFLKYYATTGHEQLHFWSENDKEAYAAAIVATENGIGGYLRPDRDRQDERHDS